MKKLLVIAIAATSLVAMQAMANVTLHIDASDLLEGDGVTMVPTTTVGLWIVDTSGGANLSPTLTLGENIGVGQTLAGSHDQVIAAIDGQNSDSPGYLGFDLINQPYVSPVAAGQAFGIIWLVNQDLATTTAEAGQYGEFSDPTGAYSYPWTLAPNGTFLEDYDMTTSSEEGGVPNAAGIANLVIAVPEPSSIVLVVMGLLGAFGLIRRRS